MILSVIGITIMLICHFAGDIYEYIDIFPFVPIFVFISGYFYKEKSEEDIGKYIWHKFKRLMLPFFIINIFYGILIQVLKKFNIINYGAEISLYTLFIQPFINNNQFVFNFPAWFVPALFTTNVIYAIIRKITYKIKWKYKEEALFIIFSILNILSVKYGGFATDENFLVIALRICFFLPFMQLGHLYQTKWQKQDEKISTPLYLLICILVNGILCKVFGKLTYDLHEFSGLNSHFGVVLITSIIGILFYTRIAKILSKYIGKNKFINYIGNNTYTIMTHHLFAIFILDFILYIINQNIIPIPYFDITRFQTGWIYVYEVPSLKILLDIFHVLLGLAVPLAFKYIYDKIKEKIDNLKQDNVS